MEQLHDDIRQCVDLLDSNKITERRKKCTELQGYLQRRDVVTLLNENTKRKEGITWEAILLTAHRGLLKEADKIRDEHLKGGDKGISKFDNPKTSFSGLISSITGKANTGGIQRINIAPLLRCVLGVLEEGFLRKHFGFTYLQVLRYQILTCHNYCANIEEDIWIDLLKLMEQLYRCPPPKVDKALILSVLNLIVKNGGKHSFLALEVKKKLPLITEIIHANGRTPGLQEDLARLALTTCQLLQYECRVAICKFGEEVMPDLRNMYDFRETGTSRKKDLLLEWFLLQMRAHHPGGRRQSEEGAYAAQWDTWCRQLGWLYQLITSEVRSILRYKNINHLSSVFITLCVAVCRQMFECDSREMLDMSMISNLADTSLMEGGGPSKRIKLETGVPAVIEILATSPQQDVWPWLCLLSALSTTHPELVSEADLSSLLQLCSEHLQTCKDITTTENLYRCCIALLFVESKKDPKLLDTVRLQELWENIWETSLRAVGLNLCEEKSHQLVQQLLCSDKSLVVDRLMELFLSGAIHRSSHSLNTLYTVATRYCIIQRFNLRQCKALQEWVLPSREEAPLEDWGSVLPCSDLVARTLVALIVKAKVPPVVLQAQQEPITDVEKHYLFTSFDNGLVTGKKSDTPSRECSGDEMLTESVMMDNMMVLLTRDHFAIKEKCSSRVGSSDAVHTLVLHTSLLVHIVATMKEWQLSADPRLENHLLECCELVAEGVKGVLMSHCEIATISSVLQRFFSLLITLSAGHQSLLITRLATDYIIKACNRLAVMSQRAHHQANEFGFEEMEQTIPTNSEETSPFSEESMQGWSQVQLAAYKIVTEACRHNTDAMSRLLSLPSRDNKDISPTCALHMSLWAGKVVCSLTSPDDELLDDLLILMQDVCRQWHANDIATLHILDIFQELCYHMDRSTDSNNRSNFIILVTGILKFIRKRKYGAHVCSRYVHLLGHIAQVDKSGSWTCRLNDDGIERPITHELLSFLQSPFHQVRVAACHNVWTLLTSSSPQQQQQVFDDLVTSLSEIFLIQGNLVEVEKLDEEIVRTATVLHVLAVLLSVTTKWRARILFHTAVIAVDKNLDKDLVKKMLTVAARHLRMASTNELVLPMLSHMVWAWHERNTGLAQFCWSMLGCSSELQFCQDHLTTLVPVLIHRRDINTLQYIASVLGQHVPHIVQTCYPELMGSILPRFADENQQQTATIILNILEKYLGDEKVKTLLAGKAREVMVNMFSVLYDPDSLRSLCGGYLPLMPEPSMLAFPTDLILGGIHHIQENLSTSDLPLFIQLSKEKPRLIQKLLLQLYSKVHHSKIPEYRVLYLHQFVTVCDMLISAVSHPQYNLTHYTIVWIVRMLLHLVGESSDTGLVATCYLHRLLSTVLPSHATVVDTVLSPITATLVPLASPDTVVGKKVLSILETLLVTNAASLPCVARLGPLPAHPMFSTMLQHYTSLRYADPLSHSLQAEIEHVIKSGDSAGRVDDLRHLRKMLAERKVELRELYQELGNSRGFSEDCEQSVLHQLICMLVTTSASSDPQARYEAACCLGELGPANLTTLCLKPDVATDSTKPFDKFLLVTVSHLIRYLFDSKVEVVQATCDALYAVFGSFGQQLNGLLSAEQLQLLRPFGSSSKGQKKAVTVDVTTLTTAMDLFCPDDICSHCLWITRLVSAILNTTQFGLLVPLIHYKEELANNIFPLVVDLVLTATNKKSTTQLFVDQINEFFIRHMNTTSADEVYGNHDSVCTMLRIVNAIRKHIDQERQINYLYVSKAALFCSSYFTSVMYAELWASENNSDRVDLDSGLSQLEYMEEVNAVNGQLLQNLLRQAYMKIGEPDAVYGCGNTHLLDPLSQIQHYQYEGRWQRVVEACDLQLSLSHRKELLPGLERALYYCGLHQLAARVSPSQSYEAAWRLGQWDCPEPADHSHESLVYTALCSLRDNDTAQALRAVRQARELMVVSLSHIGLEAATNVYGPLAKLRALQEIEDFATMEFHNVANKWNDQDRISCSKFTDIESIFAQRMTLLRIAKNLDQEEAVKMVTNCCEMAKSEGYHAVAHSWLSSHPGLSKLPAHLQWTIQLLQAQIYWDKRETDTARHLLRRLLAELEDSQHTTLRARVLQTYGSLAAHTRTEQAQLILDKYLIPALEESDDEARLVAALSLAHYADEEYQTLLNYVKSSAYTSKIKSITDSLTNAEKLIKAAEATTKRGSQEVDRQTKTDLMKTINLHDRQSKIDRMEVENAQKDLDSFLILAIRHYLMSLELGEKEDLCVFRVVSLWLNNYTSELVEAEMAERVARVPSHKLLPVLPQLAARISEDTTLPNTSTLHTLIERCAIDHPHHVLPLILALANTYKDADYSQSSLNTGTTPEGRVVGAKKMLDRLQQKDSLKKLIKDMQKVAEAYISLAYFPHNSEKTVKVHKIPKSEPIMKLKSLAHVLCPTVTLPVSKSGNYTDIVGIQGFGDTYYSVGGINVPKKITCLCTDGIKRPQLVKGNDDLRQDAVMQQVFTIMNSLLSENKETHRRRLLIRTYKVVPLSQRSGVIEWCINTVPLSTYLVGGGGVVGAHTKYRNNVDWSPLVCRQKIAEVAKQSNAMRLQAFNEVCAHFKPVFRHFFFENFPNPGIWFERKLAYTHSVATSSMVGYILGLGDRHILNILVDERTAEVIHIDFGIAFEQGKTLVTPETVPFRLTRDIIDGMGVSGIEGVFRRSCEKTMEVMRACQSTIVTILEVLLYDPLYMWTITPAMAEAKQSGKPIKSQPSQRVTDEGQVNRLAERALLRLKQKLQGIEEGSTTSVEGQVSKLIQEATNPSNLSRLFHGWQAHV